MEDLCGLKINKLTLFSTLSLMSALVAWEVLYLQEVDCDLCSNQVGCVYTSRISSGQKLSDIFLQKNAPLQYMELH